MDDIKKFLRELVEDIKNNGYLHKEDVFLKWKHRNEITGITISDVSYLLDEQGESKDVDTILDEFEKISSSNVKNMSQVAK